MENGTDWNRVGAIGTWIFGIVGVVIYMADKLNLIRGVPVGFVSWMPAAFIAVAIVLGGALHLKAAKLSKVSPRYEAGQTPEEKGRLAADTAAMYHWKGMAEGNAEELKYCHERLTEVMNIARDESKKLMEKITELESDLTWLRSREYRQFWERVGKILNYAEHADELNAKLEAVWHLWNNSGGDKLIYPLDGNTIPDPSKPLSWEVRQLLEFRILYKHHIDDVRALEPAFHSNVIDDDFPCTGANNTYLMVRRKIESHAGLLREYVSGRIQEFMCSGGTHG